MKMEIEKIESCNLIFKDGSKMAIEPASKIVLEQRSYCGNCGKYIPLHFWIYCPYCGDKSIHDIEFALRIPEEVVRKIGEKEKKE